MRVSTEEANTRPGYGRSALFLAAAPAPDTLPFPRQSQLGGGFSSLSLNSFPPGKATGGRDGVISMGGKEKPANCLLGVYSCRGSFGGPTQKAFA